MRDGLDAAHWQLRAPFFDEARLNEELGHPPALPSSLRFKYSNLGFALARRVIEAVTGEPYGDWMMREIVRPSGLVSTTPDLPDESGVPLASGHCGLLPLGERRVIDSLRPTKAMAAATGFTSTARDLARFFSSLDPAAHDSVLSTASRREMTRRQWTVPRRADPRWYGLGTFHGSVNGHDWLGHWGSFPGFITRTSNIPDWNVTISILTNAIDGPANQWGDGAIGILHTFSERGAPNGQVAGWRGRWWTIWLPIDFVPVGDRVLLADPASLTPMAYANELTVCSATEARVSLADGVAHHGERVLRALDEHGSPTRIQLGGNRLLPEGTLVREMDMAAQ
jgi:CubicO group peptidase (beta-lactamase class C family)